ncbi:MAG: RNA polymerase sigma factor [Hyphomonas sp.]
MDVPSEPVRALSMGKASEISAGDRRADQLETLYREHRSGLVARLRRVFGAGPPQPDDLAQSAFTKLASMPDISSIRDPRAFLFRMAMNLGFDQLDKQAASRRLHGSYRFHTELVQNQTAATVSLQEDLLERLERLVETLPEFDRELLRRSRLKGETLSAIALETNMSVSTLSRRLAKILADLKLRLEHETAEGDA